MFYLKVFTCNHQFQAIHGDISAWIWIWWREHKRMELESNGRRSSLDGPFHESFRTFLVHGKRPKFLNLSSTSCLLHWHKTLKLHAFASVIYKRTHCFRVRKLLATHENYHPWFHRQELFWRVFYLLISWQKISHLVSNLNVVLNLSLITSIFFFSIAN